MRVIGTQLDCVSRWFNLQLAGFAARPADYCLTCRHPVIVDLPPMQRTASLVRWPRAPEVTAGAGARHTEPHHAWTPPPSLPRRGLNRPPLVAEVVVPIG